jgi:hypothetical protein
MSPHPHHFAATHLQKPKAAEMNPICSLLSSLPDAAVSRATAFALLAPGVALNGVSF